MRNLTLWNDDFSLSSLRGLMDLQRNLDRIFEDAFVDTKGDRRPNESAFHPPCEIEEQDTHYLLSVDLPGVSRNDIGIEVRDNQLVIFGERKSERKIRGGSERSYGKFHRIVTLPAEVDADKIEAQYQDGVLTLALPKAEAAKPRQIKISDGKSSVFGKILGRSEAPEREERQERTVSASNAA